MANHWLRLWHDMPNDPKWRTIARAAKQPISSVIAIYLHILVNASTNASERGRTQNLCSEDIASALDLEAEQVDQILSAMQGRVLDGDFVSGWEGRQVEREDGSAARAKAWREKNRTQPNATERKETPEEIKIKSRQDKTSTEDKSSVGQESRVQHKEASQKRKTRLADDFSPNETGAAYAEQRGIGMVAELESFKNFHAAKGSVFLDWQAAWRTWCDKAVEFGRGSTGKASGVTKRMPPPDNFNEIDYGPGGKL